MSNTNSVDTPATVASLKRELQQVLESASLREQEQQKSVDRAREIFDLNLERKGKEIDKKYREEINKGASDIRRLEAVVSMRDSTISELTEKLRRHTEDKVAAVRQQKADQMAAVEDANSEVKRLRGEVERRRFEAEDSKEQTTAANTVIANLHKWIKEWVGFVNQRHLDQEVVSAEEYQRRILFIEERLRWELLVSRHFSPYVLRAQEAKVQHNATVKEIQTTVRSEVLLDGLPKKVLDLIVSSSYAAAEDSNHIVGVDSNHQSAKRTTSASTSSGQPRRPSHNIHIGGVVVGSPDFSRSSSPRQQQQQPTSKSGGASTTDAELYYDCLGLMVPVNSPSVHHQQSTRSVWGAETNSTSHLLTSPCATSLSGSTTTTGSLSRTPRADELLLWAARNKTELKKRLEDHLQQHADPPQVSPVLLPAALTQLGGTDAPSLPQFYFDSGETTAAAIVVSSPHHHPPQQRRSDNYNKAALDNSLGTAEHQEGDTSAPSSRPATGGGSGTDQQYYHTLDIGTLALSPTSSASKFTNASTTTIVSHPNRHSNIPGSTSSMFAASLGNDSHTRGGGGGAHNNNNNNNNIPNYFTQRNSVFSRTLSIVEPIVTSALHSSAMDVQNHVKDFADITTLLIQYLITHFILPQSLHVESLQIRILQMSEKLSCLEGDVVAKLNAMASKVQRTEAQCQRIATRVDTRQHDPKRHFVYKRRPTSPNVYTVPTCLVPEGSPHRSSIHKRAVQFSHPTVESDNSAIITPTTTFNENEDEGEASGSAMSGSAGDDNISNTKERKVSIASQPHHRPSDTSEETLQDIINSYEEELTATNSKLQAMVGKYAGGCTKEQLDTMISRLHHGERDREQIHSQLRIANKRVSDLEASTAALLQQQCDMEHMSGALIEGGVRRASSSCGVGTGTDPPLGYANESSSERPPSASTYNQSSPPHRPTSGGNITFSPDVGGGGRVGSRKTNGTPTTRFLSNNSGAVKHTLSVSGDAGSLVPTYSSTTGNSPQPLLASALARRGSSGYNNPTDTLVSDGVHGNGSHNNVSSPMCSGGVAVLTQQLDEAGSEISRLDRDNKDLKRIVKRLRKDLSELEQQNQIKRNVLVDEDNYNVSSPLTKPNPSIVLPSPEYASHSLAGTPTSQQQSPTAQPTRAEMNSLNTQLADMQMQLLAARRDRDTWRQRTDTALAQAAHSEEQRLKSVHRYLGLMGRREEETSQWIIKAAAKSGAPPQSQATILSSSQHQQTPNLHPSFAPTTHEDDATATNMLLESTSNSGISNNNNNTTQGDTTTTTIDNTNMIVGSPLSQNPPQLLPIVFPSSSSSRGESGNGEGGLGRVGGSVSVAASLAAIRQQQGGDNLSVANQIKPGGASIVEDLLARREEQLRLIQVERELVREGAKKAVEGLANQSAELAYKEELLAAKAKSLREREMTIGQAEDKVAHALRSAKLKNGGRPLLLPRNGGGNITSNKRQSLTTTTPNHSPHTEDDNDDRRRGSGGGGGVLPPLVGSSRRSSAPTLNTAPPPPPPPPYSHPQRYSPMDNAKQ